jgi:lipopolysaccharide biosynthesis glycosyltransferase
MPDKGATGIHVALAFNDDYWAPAFATMRSVCLATHRRGELVFHLCHSALTDRHRADLAGITEEFGARLVDHNLAADETFRHLAEVLPHTRHLSAEMYARILLARLVPDDIDRLVYLDCDVMVRAPIEALAEIDLGGRPLGAVREINAWRFASGRDARHRRDLFDPADPFFNSGVLAIDLGAWRRMELETALADLEAEGTLARLHNDQLVLNHLFKGNWTPLEGRWNMLARSRAVEVLEPAIVHYGGVRKPWKFASGLPFARVYRHVMTNELFWRYMRHRWRRRLFG